MEKTITALGTYKKLQGSVKITEKSKTIEVHNPSTHDEENRRIDYFLIQGTACGQIFEIEVRDEEKLLTESEQIEAKVYSTLLFHANLPDSSNIWEQLKQKGYH